MTDDTKKQTADKNIQSTKRRGALKSIGGSAAAIAAAQNLPETWKKPLVDSIILPAHANTTSDSDSSGDDNIVTTVAATKPPMISTSCYTTYSGGTTRLICNTVSP